MGIRNCDLVFVSQWCPNRKFFYLRWASMIPKQAFPLAISKWTGLEGMEVNECTLRRETLQQIQSSCKNFVYLKVAGRLSICTAYDIVNCLQKLKTIDLSYTEFMHDALLHILKGCKELESLDITGCGKLGMDPAVQKLAAHVKTFHYDSAPFPDKLQQQYCLDCFDDSDYYEYGTVNCFACSCLHGYYY